MTAIIECICRFRVGVSKNRSAIMCVHCGAQLRIDSLPDGRMRPVAIIPERTIAERKANRKPVIQEYPRFILIRGRKPRAR